MREKLLIDTLPPGLDPEFEGHRPLQLWARWYGFSVHYPDTRIL